MFLHLFVCSRGLVGGVHPSIQWGRQREGCVSQHAMRQAERIVCIPACIGEGRGRVYPSMQCKQGRYEAGGSHPTGVHPYFTLLWCCLRKAGLALLKMDPFYFYSVSIAMSSTPLLCIQAYLLVTVHVYKVDEYVLVTINCFCAEK